MSFDPKAEINDAEALTLIREIVNSGEIIYSSHVKQRMRERNYTTNDITFILENGKITSKEFNEDVAFQNWTYRITGDDLDGDSGSVVVAIISKSGLLIITVLA